MNNKALLGASAAVLVALGGLTGTAIFLQKRRGAAQAVTLSRLPAESVVVVRGQMASLRSFGPAQALQRWLTGSAPAQGPDVTREAREAYRGLTQACGFDPWDRAQSFSFGVDRAATEARNASAMVLYADGRFSEAEARRCAEYILGRAQQSLRAQEVEGRTVYAIARAGAEPDARAPALWFRNDMVMLTERPYVATALGLASGSAAGLRDDAPVSQMLAVLGGANVLEVAGDVAQLRRQNPQSAGELVDGLVRDNPAQPNLTLAREVHTVGFSAQLAGGGVSMRLRIALPQESQAAAFGAALQGVLVARRGEMLRVLEEGQGQLRAAQLMVALTAPEMRARIDDVDAGLTTARQVIESVRATAEARHAVVSLDIAPQQVQSLERAVRAASDVAQLLMRDGPRPRLPLDSPADEAGRAPMPLPGPGLALPGLPLPPPGATPDDPGAVQGADAATR